MRDSIHSNTAMDSIILWTITMHVLENCFRNKASLCRIHSQSLSSDPAISLKTISGMADIGAISHHHFFFAFLLFQQMETTHKQAKFSYIWTYTQSCMNPFYCDKVNCHLIDLNCQPLLNLYKNIIYRICRYSWEQMKCWGTKVLFILRGLFQHVRNTWFHPVTRNKNRQEELIHQSYIISHEGIMNSTNHKITF